MGTNNTLDDDIERAIHGENSPFEFCDDCGQAIIKAKGGGHSCDPKPVFDGKPRAEEVDLLQTFDEQGDRMVAYAQTYRSQAYHRTTETPDGETKPAPECVDRIEDQDAWTYEERDEVVASRPMYPCTVCHDLPMDEINERIREMRKERYGRV